MSNRFYIRYLFAIITCRNNECPACRIHCASRRSLRDDLDYDALIDAIYPDVEKYEEEVEPIYYWSKNVYSMGYVFL